jgi:Transposase DDE domain
VEPVFGQIKQGRGFRQFLLRGLCKVRGEWALICTTHNVLKLWTALHRRRRRPECGLRALGGSKKTEGRAHR